MFKHYQNEILVCKANVIFYVLRNAKVTLNFASCFKTIKFSFTPRKLNGAVCCLANFSFDPGGCFEWVGNCLVARVDIHDVTWVVLVFLFVFTEVMYFGKEKNAFRSVFNNFLFLLAATNMFYTIHVQTM